MAFTDFPDQWELYKRERPATTADEIVRWATPVTSFQRTALEDNELSGVQIKKGQRVVMVYRSANFDEDVFEDPFPSTSCVIPTRTSDSVAPARTTASAPTWHG